MICVFDVADLVAVDHNVVCGDEGFEQDHPAGVGGALKQRVGQLRDVNIHLIGALDQIWWEKEFMNIIVFTIQTVGTPLHLWAK